ncbi:hypothetical protein [Clostridium sp.]|uniref:hypothetical protein n=1 Tax=Clostridium sp. TaxID=1506 RepID=UPI001A3E473F|nr:hypothetical protein [Clostridium sp.]MBK5234410.1 hypothetical protein [Clostridium sp.]
MIKFILMVVALCIAVIFITYLIHKVAGRKKYAKYIPTVLFLFMGIYNIYMIRTNPGEGFGDIIKALYLFICTACFISAVGTGVFIDFILPKLKK